MSDKWNPTHAEITWAQPPDENLDGEKWPKEITLIAWERNNDGEKRIKARQVYTRNTE